MLALITPEVGGHSMPKILRALLLSGGRIRGRVALIRAVASAVTIGSGGAAGRVGPSAQMGAVAGSLLAQLLRLDASRIRLLTVCGVSGGMAGALNAPLAAAMFSLEALMRGVGIVDSVPVILSSIAGAEASSLILGARHILTVNEVSSWHPLLMPLSLALSVAVGFAAVLWIEIFQVLKRVFRKASLPSPIKPALGGLAMGIVGLYPLYLLGGAWLEPSSLAKAEYLDFTQLIAVGVLTMLANSLTLGSGGSGGVFGPALCMGVALGRALEAALAQLTWAPSSLGALPLLGAAAFLAGSMQAPIFAALLIPEASGYPGLLPLSAISSAGGFLSAWVFLRGSSIHTLELKSLGLRMGRPFTLDLLKVRDFMIREVVALPYDAPLAALRLLSRERDYTGYPVVRGGSLVGVVPPGRVISVAESSKVGELAERYLVYVYSDESAYTALERMEEAGLSRLPVVERGDPSRVVGIVEREDLLRAYPAQLRA
ncbi:MAG: hypothetical protein DRK00_00455 [Thermoprotei archaeon]|nr:MAG: hypothetical protein DRK00_00455 [Thermoprotei archaeon]